jgi:hypothetical protein
MEVIHANYVFDECRGSGFGRAVLPGRGRKIAAPSSIRRRRRQRNVAPERAHRPAAEPMNSSVARPEMKSRGAAKQEMNSATGPSEKAMPGDAAKKRNAERPMQSSAGKQPATAPGETAKQGRHATRASSSSRLRRSYANFTYQAGSWSKPRRVITSWVSERGVTMVSPAWGRPGIGGAATTPSPAGKSQRGVAGVIPPRLDRASIRRCSRPKPSD